MTLSYKKIVFSVIILLAVIVFIYKFNKAKPLAVWHMIDVNYARGQGDAHLIIVDKHVVMIDIGCHAETREKVIPYLNSLGINKIDHFFISHAHRDHYEGLADLYNAKFIIENLYYYKPYYDEGPDCCYKPGHFQKWINYAEEHGSQLHTPKEGFEIIINEQVKLNIIHVQQGKLNGQDVDVNDLSFIMRLSAGTTDVLFTGDLNKVVGQWLANHKDVKADILKVPHHGLASLAPDSFFEAVSPQAMLVPSTHRHYCSRAGNQVREFIKKHAMPTWVNGLDGTVVTHFFDDYFTIESKTRANCERALDNIKLQFLSQ